MKATELRCDYRQNPIGIGGAQPRLDWILSSEGYCDAQTAAQVQVSLDRDNWAESLAWDSGVVNSSHNSMIYGGPAVPSNTLVYWRVRVWDASGACGEWSETACWRQGITQSDWRAGWIG